MGDALMQVLDIAEQIQAGRRPRPMRRPRHRASPAPSSAARRRRRRPAPPSAPADVPSGQPLVAAILLSDGANSVGQAEPLDAAERAATLDVPIYTIALGTPDGSDRGPRRLRAARHAATSRRTPRPSSRSRTRPAPRRSTRRPRRTSQASTTTSSRGSATPRRPRKSPFALVGAGLLLVVVGAGLSAVWFGRLAVDAVAASTRISCAGRSCHGVVDFHHEPSTSRHRATPIGSSRSSAGSHRRID